MRVLLFFFLFKLLTSVVNTEILSNKIICDEDTCQSNSREHDCLKIDSIGGQLQCLGSQYNNQKLTLTALERKLFAVISQFPSDKTFWSIGLEMGANTRVTIARQNHYNFDWFASFRTNPLAIGHDVVFYVHEADTSRPTVIFTDSPLELEHFPEMALAGAVLSGSGKTKTVYALSVESEKRMMEHEGCTAWNLWTQIAAFRRFPKVAMVMPLKYYCKDAQVNYDVSIGEYEANFHDIAGFKEKIIEPIWERTANGDFGDVPTQAPSDF